MTMSLRPTHHPVSILSLALVGAACAQAPSKELAMTAKQVELAREQDAPVFAPDAFGRAEASLQEASRRIDAKEYRSAIRALADARQNADDASSRAKTERMVVEQRLAQTLFELDGLLSMATGHGAREASPAETASLEARVAAVHELEKKGHLIEALDAGSSLKPVLLALEQRFRSEAASERR
jgi:hypothetical protein